MAFQQSSRANGSVMALARGLGWFSIGLGLAEMLAPRMLGKQLGMEGKESLLRFYGAREMAAGVGILMSDNPGPWIWGRVAGDALDLATLATGLDKQNPRNGNVAIAVAAVAGLALACGGASALNHVLDRDIDPLMGERTKRRPVASGRIAPARALEFGLALSALSFVLRTPEELRPFTSQPAQEPVLHSRA